MKLAMRLSVKLRAGGRKDHGPLAQLAEQWTLNPPVAGSTPARLTKQAHKVLLVIAKFPYYQFTIQRQLWKARLPLYIPPLRLQNKKTDSVRETFLSDASAGDVGEGCCRRRRRVIAGNGAITAAEAVAEVVP